MSETVERAPVGRCQSCECIRPLDASGTCVECGRDE